MKISLITVSFNAGRTIGQCIESVIAQNFTNLEYIIIDGGSTDNTINIINRYKKHISIFVSEPDLGIYDAMNKGIKLAGGDVIGMINADDSFADDSILSLIAQQFTAKSAAIVYGDLDYVDMRGNVIRKWRSGEFKKGIFNWGWMPPHPTFYCRKDVYLQFGVYSLEYGTAADYELMVRIMHRHEMTICYLKKVIINMKNGGISNKTYFNRVKGLLFDLKAMQNNGISAPLFTLLLKPVRKIVQYL